jgi:hypothetical protein
VEPRNDWRYADGEVRITRVKWWATSSTGAPVISSSGRLAWTRCAMSHRMRWTRCAHWSRPAALLALVSTSAVRTRVRSPTVTSRMSCPIAGDRGDYRRDGNQILQGAVVGPLADGEQTMARKLWPKLGPGM